MTTGDDDLGEVTGLLPSPKAAQHAGVSRHTISGWITAGTLPSRRIAGRRYVHPTDLAATQKIAHVGDWCQPGGRIVVMPAGDCDSCGAGVRAPAPATSTPQDQKGAGDGRPS